MTRRAIRGRWARAALAALWLAGTLLAPATTAAINLPPSQEGKSVYDLADVWDDSSVAQAEAIIGAVRSATQAEIAVVSWPTGLDTVSTELAEADARTIMDTWGIGRAGFDDGLVVLFDLDKSLEHGQIYLRTGAGFKAGYLTDEEAKSIVDETMLPLAADGSLDAAMLAGLAQIASHTAGFDPVTPGSPGSSGSGGTPNPKEPVGPVLPPSREGVYVYDIAHIWTEATIQEAQRIATAIRQRTQAQIAVVSWPTGYGSVDTGTARADAIKIMDTWGVGRAGVNDGLVVLFDMDDTLHHGQIYVYAGSGFLEQYLDVGESVALVNDEMLPKAKDGDLDGALLQGMRVIDRVVQPGGNPDRWLRNLMLALVAGGVAAIAVLGLLAFLRMWWTRGRDARVVLIDDSVLLPAPPPNLTPALATVLRRDEVDDDSFTSALVDLGHRGLLTFEQADGNKKHINLVTPAALVRLLQAMRQHPAGESFMAALPRAGEGGSLLTRFDGTAAQRHVVAKPGTITRVNALAGFLELEGGRTVTFAILANHHPLASRVVVAQIDTLVVDLARHLARRP